MPELVLKSSGKPVFVPPERLDDALASGLYEPPATSEKVAVEVRPGVAGETTVGELGAQQAAGYNPESEAAFRDRERSARIDRERGGVIDKGLTVVENAANEATLGGFGAVGEFLGGDEYTEARLERAEANPIYAGAGKVAGILGPALGVKAAGAAGQLARATPPGQVTKVAGAIGKAGEGASLATRGARFAGAATFEGGAQGLGTGIQELTDSTEPITWERATSVLSSNALFGAEVALGTGLAGKVVGKALTKARTAMNEYAARGGRELATEGADVAGDLAGLDAKGLKAARTAELDAIEAARVGERKTVSEEIAAFRRDMKEQKVWLATKGAEDAELRAIGKRTLKADRQLDNLIDDPKYFAENPKGALSALRKQEAALDELVTKHGDTLRQAFAKDTSGARMAALENAGKALERNRALQQRIADITATPSSPRLTAIEDAREALALGATAKKGMPQQLLEGTVFGKATAAVGAVAAAIPGGQVLAMLAPAIGAKAAKLAGDAVFGKLGTAVNAAAARSAKAVDAIFDVAAKAAPRAPVISTRVLEAVSFGPRAGRARAAREDKADRRAKLAAAYQKRAEEVRNLTAYGPDGRPAMRPEARQQLAERLAPIAAVDPVLADRMETTAARRLELYARRMPRKPDTGVIETGPGRWQPSEMEIRSWARTIAAGEDPGGIEERVADGTITPEDAEVMREVYPERLAELTQQVLERLPTLQRSLPFHRRLALSILTGVPVDPAMHPAVLTILQGTFAREAGTAGGTQAPRAQPQFGSVKAEAGTNAQRREEGTR